MGALYIGSLSITSWAKLIKGNSINRKTINNFLINPFFLRTVLIIFSVPCRFSPELFPKDR